MTGTAVVVTVITEAAVKTVIITGKAGTVGTARQAGWEQRAVPLRTGRVLVKGRRSWNRLMTGQGGDKDRSIMIRMSPGYESLHLEISFS